MGIMCVWDVIIYFCYNLLYVILKVWLKFGTVKLTEDEAMHGDKNRIMIGTHCSHAHTTS